MKITPSSLSTFSYCPYLYSTLNGDGSLFNVKTFFEKAIIRAIVDAERNCLLKESELIPKKIIRAWDKEWWPSIDSIGLTAEQGEKLSIKASQIFNDYCKYDLSGYMFPTIAVDVDKQVMIGNSILHSNIDLIKVDLSEDKKNIVLVDFSNIDHTERDLSIDIYVMAKAYSFYTFSGEQIKYVHVFVDTKQLKLKVTSSVYRENRIYEMRNTLKHLEQGMRTGVNYMNRWNCKECKKCKNFKF